MNQIIWCYKFDNRLRPVGDTKTAKDAQGIGPREGYVPARLVEISYDELKELAEKEV